MPIAYSDPKLHILCHIQKGLESIWDTKVYCVTYHSTDVCNWQSLRCVSKSTGSQNDKPVLKAESLWGQQYFSIFKFQDWKRIWQIECVPRNVRNWVFCWTSLWQCWQWPGQILNSTFSKFWRFKAITTLGNSKTKATLQIKSLFLVNLSLWCDT